MMQAAQTPPPAPRQGPPQAAPAPLPTLEQSFELLKEFKVGTDSTVLIPIERAVMEVHGNETARAALEKRLVAYLGSSYSSVTRSFVCRQLVLIGSAASVPAVTPLVLDEELSVHARNVLEHIPGPESEKALRDALGQAKGRTRIGVINSVAARRDAASTSVLIKILGEDPQSAAAAAKALGEIGTSEATKALVAARGKGPAPVQQAVVDGTLICADRLVATGQRSQAITLLEGLTEASQPEHVRRGGQEDAVRCDTQVIAARHRHGEEAQGPESGSGPSAGFAFSLLPVLFPHSVSRAQEQPARERHVSEFRGLTMGGTFSVKIVTPKDELETPGLHDVDRALRSTLDRIEGLMSTWDRDSELSRFNRSTSLEPFAVSPETFEVFKWSIDVGSLTGGALDVTIGPLVDAWGFGPSGPRKTRADERRDRTGCGRRSARVASSSIRRP